MPTESRKGGFRRWLRIGRRVSLIGTPIIVVAMWLAFQHKPTWYRPAALDEDGLQRARRDAVAAVDDFGDRLVQGRPFEVTLTDRSINEWLAGLPEIWPDAKDALPPEIKKPQVKFAPGVIGLAAHIEKGGWQAVISIDLGAEVSPDGTSIRTAAHALRAGSLRIPPALLRRVNAWMNPPEKETIDAGQGERISLGQLFSGITSRNRFVWPNGERAFRIHSITATHGELRLRIEPL